MRCGFDHLAMLASTVLGQVLPSSSLWRTLLSDGSIAALACLREGSLLQIYRDDLQWLLTCFDRDKFLG
jgi:hypothetical protein